MKAFTKTILTNPVHFLAFGFGAGLSPFAPGTVGTLVAIPFILLMSGLSLPIYLAITLAVTILGILLAHYSSRWLGVHDHGGIVIDEIAAMMLVMAFFPIDFKNLVLAFFLFRFFDVVKPWPIRKLDEKVHGGLGIMIDDTLAAIYTIITQWCFLKALQLIFA